MKGRNKQTSLLETLLNGSQGQHEGEQQQEQQQSLCKDTFWPCAFNLAKVVTGVLQSHSHVVLCL
jgi:hypothetical protein